jgi:mRNA-degrading endonuclease RelE of RelBE toxin-antitoxin system
VHRIEIMPTALRELADLGPFVGRPIVQAIEEQLTLQPTVPTRRRKRLEGLKPSFEAVPPVWELRVGEFRVFYDVYEDD